MRDWRLESRANTVGDIVSDLISEIDNLEKQLDKLNEEYDELQNDYDDVVKNEL